MVSIYIHPTVDRVKARAVVTADTANLKFTMDGGEITVCGHQKNAEAFRMIADIFNDAFARKAEPCTPAR